MRILKESFIYLIGELFAKSLPFLMLPYLTRKFGPEGFGELSYYLTWLALFSVFVGLSQEGAVTRYYYFYGRKALNTIIKAGYLYNIVISAILLVICCVLKAEIMAYIVLATMFQSFVNVQLALHQCQKQPLKYITIQIILSLTNAIFTIVALELFSNELVAYRILAIVASNSVTFFIASMILGNLFSDENKITAKRLKLGLFYIFSFGVPLILHQSSFFIKGQLDRFFIYEQYSKAELGIYSAGVQIASVLPIIILAFNKAIIPYYYEAIKKKKLNMKILKKYTLVSSLFCFLPAFIIFFFPEKYMLYFLGDGYSGVSEYIFLYSMGYGLIIPYLILVNYFFYHAKNFFIAKINLVSSILYIVLLIFLGNYSISYIPYALFFSNLVMIIFLWVYLDKD